MSHVCDIGITPIGVAVHYNHLEAVQQLSSYGALRSYMLHGQAMTAEQVAASRHNDGTLSSWLVLSREWTTPLHHLRIISPARARALLRGGADLSAASAAGGPTPLALAQEMSAAGEAPEGSPAHLVLQAAQPWSPDTHALFPAPARQRAVLLLLLGARLSREPRFEGDAGAILDVWRSYVLPCALQRHTT